MIDVRGGSISRLYVLAMMISRFEFEYIYTHTHAYARIEEGKADTPLDFPGWIERNVCAPEHDMATRSFDVCRAFEGSDHAGKKYQA